MKRRNFLKNTSTLSLAAPALLNGLNILAIPQSRLFELMNLNNDKVLVLIQLQGGNDGLNTVIPLDQYDRLSAVRSNILLPENSLLKIDEKTAFHPAMEGLKNLYNEGQVNIIHSVGYPNQNRSHFRSTDIWTAATAADEFDARGWLGKYFDSQYDNFPTDFPNTETPHPIAITMGPLTSETCQGISANYSLAISDPFALSPLAQGQESTPPDTPYGNELAFIREAIAQTNAYTEVISEIANKGVNMTAYPSGNRLAEQLKNVALLLAGGIQTKIFVCAIGGFDTHASQVEDASVLNGVHANLLTQVSEAVTAFQSDLKQLGLEERVLGMTFSEFGRQIASNLSLGTDHGTAAPLLVFGSCVNPGFIGVNPEIPEELAPQEGVAMQIDFRDVYGSVLMDWFEVPEADVRELIFADFQHLPIIGGCESLSTSTDTEALATQIDISIYPNPFVHNFQVQFNLPTTHARLSLFDARGAELKVVFDKQLPAGFHQFNVETASLPAGNYYLHLRTGEGQLTRKVVKVR